MKTKYLFSFAALALIMSACSSDENIERTSEPSANRIPFSAVISANATTRGLTEDENHKAITAKWEVGEQVAIIHSAIIDTLTITAVDNQGQATIEGYVNTVNNYDMAQVVYAGSKGMEKFLKDMKSFGFDDFNKDYINAMLRKYGQGGTLQGINDSLDYRYAQTPLRVTKNSATFTTATALLSQNAIWKVDLTTDGTTLLNANPLSIIIGKDTLVADMGTDSSSFYMAFVPNSTSYQFLCTDKDGKILRCKFNLREELKPGYYYKSTLTMRAINYVTKLALDQANLKMIMEDTSGTYTLKTTITPTDATDKAVTWKSSDVNIATVDENGKVTAVGQGKATITCTATNGTSDTDDDETATCEVEVFAPGSVPYIRYNVMTNAYENDVVAADNFWKLSNSTDISEPLAAGTYVVSEDTEFLEAVFFKGDVELIIADGKKLTCDYCLGDDTNYSLTIHGQKERSGKITANYMTVNKLTFDGGSLEVKNNNAGGNAIKANNILLAGGSLTAIGGPSDATNTAGYGIMLSGLLNANVGTLSAHGLLGIYSETMDPIRLSNGLKLYEGDDQYPTDEAANQNSNTKPYAMIK
jgi:hypothetical protein